MEKYKLGDIAEITMGQSPKAENVNTKNIGLPLLNGPTEFTEFFPIPVQYTDKGNKFAEKGDILFCVRGSTTGKMNFSDQKYAIGRGLASIRGINGYSTDFIRVILDQNLPSILSIATGSTFPNVGREQLQKIEIPVIDRVTANKIGDIYREFSNKILYNTEINQTLESIAQAIFKSWFIDFDPVRAKAQALADGKTAHQANLAAMAAISGKAVETLKETEYQQLWQIAESFPNELVENDEFGEVPLGWECTRIENIAQFVKGKKPKEVFSTQENGMLPHILMASLNGVYTEYCIPEKLIIADKYETLMLMDGAASGKIAIGHNGVVGSTFAKMKLENQNYWAVLYHFLKFKEDDIQKNTTGTTIPHTDKKRVLDYLITVPNEYLLEIFNSMFKNILDSILINKANSNDLVGVRDLVLPKLLSGELPNE